MALVSSRFPYIPLQVKITQQQEVVLDIEALVDTGFDGDLIIPRTIVAPGLRPDTHLTWRLADGFDIDVTAYLGEVELPGLEGIHPVLISVLGEEPIVGRGVTDHFALILDHGLQVVVEL